MVSNVTSNTNVCEKSTKVNENNNFNGYRTNQPYVKAEACMKLVSPEDARLMLQCSPFRGFYVINTKEIKKFAQLMTDGEFKEPAVIMLGQRYENGQRPIVDGLLRLEAIVMSGVSINCSITTNIDDSYILIKENFNNMENTDTTLNCYPENMPELMEIYDSFKCHEECVSECA